MRPRIGPVFALAVLLFAGCAVLPGAPGEPQQPVTPLADAPFAIEGRMSARRGNEAVSAGFVWRHDPPRDELVVTSPLGQVLAELAGDTSRQTIRLTLADGRSDSAGDWARLTERALGFALPVDGLAAWMRGVPHPGSAYAVEPDAKGRARLLRQDGWEIVYGYDGDDESSPARLRLTDAQLEVRIVIDRRF